MKNMKLFFSSILLLLVCQFNSAKAFCDTDQLPIYQNVIEDISLYYDEAMLVGDIRLDSQLIMHIVDYKTRDDNVMNTWTPGDTLALQGHLKDDALVISASRMYAPVEDTVEAYLIFDMTESPYTGLTVVDINENGKYVKLNDDSVWHFSWYNRFSTSKWSIGERVIVSGDAEKNCYEFINLDAPLSLEVYSAKGSFVMN